MRVGDAVERIRTLGVDHVAHLFFDASAASEDRPQDWVVGAVVFGEDWTDAPVTELSLEVWWTLAMAALDACPDDDVAYWLLGDGTFDHMRAKPGIEERLRAEREHNPSVQRLFVAMQRELPSEGVADGFWFE